MEQTHPANTDLQEKHSNAAVLDAAKALLVAAGFANDDVDTALGAIKDANKTVEADAEVTYKNYVDKTAVYEDVEAYIYKRGDTKSGIWYFRIWDSKRQKAVFKSLKTTDKIAALTRARKLYVDVKGKIDRGERLKEITTRELVTLWKKELQSQITDIPHRGIVMGTYKVKRNFLNNWLEYVEEELGYKKTPIDKIKPYMTRNFAKWMEAKPKKTSLQTGSRCREKINNNCNEIVRMYHKLAVRDRYIGVDGIPQIDRLKYEIDETVKRHIPTLEQYDKYIFYLKRKYFTKKHNPSLCISKKGLKELEVRKIFAEFILILANGGFRTKELLGIKFKEITPLLNPTDDDIKQGNIVLEIRKENSKTGRRRSVVAPLRKRIDRLIETYKRLGVTHEPDDFLFINVLSPNRNHYGRMIMYQRLKKTLVASGLQEELDAEHKSISPYSFRHFYCYLRLIHGVPIHILAKNMGTSVEKIEKNYGHINTQLHADVITKGQGILRRTETNIDVTRVIEDNI